MATTFKWVVGEGAVVTLTTGLDSLASGNTALSASIDNTTGLYEFMDLELLLASANFPAGGYVCVSVLYSLDGTNYEDGTAGTPGVIPSKPPSAIFPLRTVNGAQRISLANIPIAPLKFYLHLYSVAGVTLASSGNTLSYNRHYEQGV